MRTNFTRLFILATCSSLLFACSQEINLEDLGGSAFVYKVLSQNSVVADGFSDLTLILQVQDKEGNAVPGHTPTLTPGVTVSATGVNYFSCSSSDGSGLSTCTFRSNYEGTKLFSINKASNAGDRSFGVTFIPSPEKQGILFSVVPGAQPPTVEANGDTVSATVGNMVDNARQRINSNEWILRADISVKY